MLVGLQSSGVLSPAGQLQQLLPWFLVVAEGLCFRSVSSVAVAEFVLQLNDGRADALLICVDYKRALI